MFNKQPDTQADRIDRLVNAILTNGTKLDDAIARIQSLEAKFSQQVIGDKDLLGAIRELHDRSLHLISWKDIHQKRVDSVSSVVNHMMKTSQAGKSGFLARVRWLFTGR